jgi:hypothetical protein
MYVQLLPKMFCRSIPGNTQYCGKILWRVTVQCLAIYIWRIVFSSCLVDQLPTSYFKPQLVLVHRSCAQWVSKRTSNLSKKKIKVKMAKQAKLHSNDLLLQIQYFGVRMCPLQKKNWSEQPGHSIIFAVVYSNILGVDRVVHSNIFELNSCTLLYFWSRQLSTPKFGHFWRGEAGCLLVHFFWIGIL